MCYFKRSRDIKQITNCRIPMSNTVQIRYKGTLTTLHIIISGTMSTVIIININNNLAAIDNVNGRVLKTPAHSPDL